MSAAMPALLWRSVAFFSSAARLFLRSSSRHLLQARAEDVRLHHRRRNGDDRGEARDRGEGAGDVGRIGKGIDPAHDMPPSFRGARSANPESILRRRMDSGFIAARCPGMTERGLLTIVRT
jgi:hypothetical protein